MSGQIRYFTEPAILWLAGTVMDEVVAHNIFHGASVTVVGHILGLRPNQKAESMFVLNVVWDQT